MEINQTEDSAANNVLRESVCDQEDRVGIGIIESNPQTLDEALVQIAVLKVWWAEDGGPLYGKFVID